MSIKRFMVLGDIHGDMQCPRTLEVAFKFMADWKPHIRVCTGDVFDCRPLRGKASDDERRESLAEDWGMGMRFLGDYRPHALLLGNHDVRLYHQRDRSSNGVIRDSCAQAIVDLENKCGRLKCQILPYDARHGVYHLGGFRVVHGFFHGKFCAARHAETYGRCIFGHDHAISEFRNTAIDDRHARGIGCCCRLGLGYDDATPGKLRHENGFAYGWINDKTGSCDAYQARSVGGKWFMPTGVKEY